MNALKGFAPLAHWLPRLALAAIFGYHALPKLTASGAVAQGMGMPAAVVLLVGVAEFGGAVLMLYGGVGVEWATQLAGLLFAAIMLGAIFMVHLQHGWNSIGNMGMEFQVLILATSLYLAARGNKS